MGMILDFQKKNGYVRYVSPQMELQRGVDRFVRKDHWTWGAIGPAGLAYNPSRSRRPGAKTWTGKRSIRNGRTPSRSSCPLQACSTYPGSNCGCSTVADGQVRRTEAKRLRFSYVQQFDRLVTSRTRSFNTRTVCWIPRVEEEGGTVGFNSPAAGLPATPEAWGIPTEGPHPTRPTFSGLVPFRSRT